MLNYDTIKTFAETNRLSLIGFTTIASFVYLTNRFYFAGGVCKSKRRLEGKTVIITGANTGIGYETALDLAKRGARIILACRDSKRANQAASQIRKLSGNGNVIVELVDLASFDSIREFCKRIEHNEPRLDILINNAGIMACPKWKTKDGFEMQFGVNHLGHFLLTNLLLDKLETSAPSRIVNVSSRAYERGKMNWDDLNGEKSYEPRVAYNQSKLCNILFTRELAERLKGTKVTTVSLHPGVVRTELGRYFSDSYGWKAYVFQILFMPIIYWWFKSSKQGAQTSLHCAIAEDVDAHSGSYYFDCQVKALLPQALNDDDARRLWELSEKFTKLK